MSLSIRFAAPDDAVTILRLISYLPSTSTNRKLLRLLSQHSAPNWKKHIHLSSVCSPNSIAVRLVSRCSFVINSTWNGRPGLFLEDLFVLEEYRSRGVGGALMRRLREIVAERGWGRMEWAVLNWNTTAQNFYQGHSARPLDEWTLWRIDGEPSAIGQPES